MGATLPKLEKPQEISSIEELSDKIHTVLLIGAPGSGKSCLGNSLLGTKDVFNEGSSFEHSTKALEIRCGYWLGDEELGMVQIIDT